MGEAPTKETSPTTTREGNQLQTRRSMPREEQAPNA
jgi:hypothetical protein